MPFKVIIIGGSVSGLTMAHTLERAGIEYILLERGPEVTFNGGASIGLQPHGLRIMDQMGMYEDILGTTTPMLQADHRLPSGKAFARSRFALQIEERHGYPILFFERAELLEILYNHLPDRSKIRCSKRVVDIQSTPNAAIAVTDDGSSYSADMIIGADGVHSTTRKMMWKMMAKQEPEFVQKESTSMFSEYSCAFGVSVFDSEDPELLPGTSHINYSEKRSHICIVSTRKRKFWFLIEKLDKRYYAPNIPRFSEADLEGSVLKNSDIQVTEHTTLGDLWKHKSKTTMVCLEEVMFDRWSHDRLVLLGDSVHKVTPNAGHGGNTAIESAAVLANLLYEAKMGTRKGFSLTHEGLLSVFREYQANREARVANACQKSAAATRIQAMDNFLWKTGALRIIPLFGEHMEVNAASALIMGGEPLKFAEYKGKDGSIPWDGWEIATLAESEKRSFFDSMLGYSIYLALPLILVWTLRQSSVWLQPDLSTVEELNATRLNEIMLVEVFPDNFNRPPVTNASNPWSLFTACLEIISIGLMMAVEGVRANDPRKLRLDIFAAAVAFRFGGLGIVGPLYFLAHGLETFNLSGPDPRGNVVPLSVAKSLPKVFFTSILFTFALISNMPGRIIGVSPETSIYFLTALIQVLPVLPSALIRFFTVFGQTEAGKTMMGHADMESLQVAYVISGLVSAVFHGCNLFYGALNYTAQNNSISSGRQLLEMLLGASGLNGELRSTYIGFTFAAMLWVFWCCRMVIPAEAHTASSRFKLTLAVGASVVIVGPGATASFLWLWREDKTRCDKAAGLKLMKSLDREDFMALK